MKIGMLLSGGIDSMMSARLLQEQGHEVLGITMMTQDNFDVRPAQQAAEWLHIEHKIIHLEELFQKYVIDYFCSTYEKGETPNPCITCNEYVKLGALSSMALHMGCDKVATGHYAYIDYDPDTKVYSLHKGTDPRKDQSYFLYRLNQEVLSHLIFPLGKLCKDHVREMARERNFPEKITEGHESQDICFLPADYRDFLQGRVHSLPGTFTDEEGKILGRHKGIAWYTIGQRKGLGISAPHPLYVLHLDPKSQRITLGNNEDLFKKHFYIQDCVWSTPGGSFPKEKVQVKVRYAARPVWAQISLDEKNRVQVELEEPQRALTPGQSAVFYDGDCVLGGGIIKTSPYY